MATKATDPAASTGVGAYGQTHGEELRAQFEKRRIALFRERGLAVEGRRIADATGRDTYALVSGNGPCPTVLIHGGVGNTVEWADIAPDLTGPLVIPDRPGFGLSQSQDYRQVDCRVDAARWLSELADGLRCDEVDLVANSMGGFFAIAFATAHPERVRRLVLSGAAGGLFSSLGPFLQLWATPGVGALISKMKIRDTETLRKRVFGGYLTHPERLADDLLEVALTGMNLPGAADTNRAILQSVATLRGWRPDMRLDESLAALAVPTLFAWGDTDQLAKPDVAQALASRMPHAEVTVIQDAGHLPHLDQPAAVAAAVNAFLQE
jgi:pimeloyl-ACP methyl ester carboxylesterase